MLAHFGRVLNVPREDYNGLLVSNDAVAFGDEASHRREARNATRGCVPGVPEWLHVDMSVEELGLWFDQEEDRKGFPGTARR